MTAGEPVVLEHVLVLEPVLEGDDQPNDQKSKTNDVGLLEPDDDLRFGQYGSGFGRYRLVPA